MNLQNPLPQPPVPPSFPLANPSLPRDNNHLPPSPFLPSLCNLVPHSQTQGALQRQFFTPSVETFVSKAKKTETHVNAADRKPRFQSDPPTHLLGDLGQLPAHL